MRRLGDIADLSWGDTKTTKSAYVEAGFLAYSATGPDGRLPWADYNKTGVVVSAIGAQCGKTWLAKDRWSCIKNTLRFFAKDDFVSTEYLYWATRDPSIWPIRGSAQPFISQGDARGIRVSLPPVEAQWGIAATLGALDDKIESNRRQDALLARLIPALFQARVPAGNRRPLAEIATCAKGVSYRSADLATSRTALVTLKSFDRNGGYKPVGLKPYIGPYKPAQELAPGELAVAQTDLTQAADVVGRVIRVPGHASFDVFVASLDLVIVRPLPGVPLEFLYAVMLGEDFREHCRSRTSGTTVLHLASDAIASYRAPLPDPSVQESYANEVRPLLVRRDALVSEQATLTALRDALLPELLSGRIRVPEAREAVQSAS